MISSLFRNVRYAVRTLLRTPSLTATVILTLAFAIGANSAVFSALDGVLLRPLPFPDADQLVRLSEVREGTGQTGIAPVRLEDWNRLNSTFEAISGYTANDVVDTTADLPERRRQAIVGPRFLDVLGVSPELGRGFTEAEHRFGAPTVVQLSERLWRDSGADPNILGGTIQSVGRSVTIIGVMPAFPFSERDVDVWGAFAIDAPFAQSRDLPWLAGIGRLKPGVKIEQARADLARVQAQLAEQYPDTDRTVGVHLEPFKGTIVGPARGSLWLLFGAVSALLLIACTNVAALLLSRATQREQEIAVRYSLGASRRAVVAQLLTEAAVLAFAGAALGLVIAAGAPSAFRAIAPDLPRVEEVAIDARIVAYTIAAATAVALLCGLLPALRSAGSLKQRAQISPRHSLQWLLVGLQTALAVALLAGAGLLLRSLDELSRVDRGFDATQVLAFHVTARIGDEGNYSNVVARINRTLDEIAALPGVETAATSSMLPGVPGERPEEFGLVEGRADAEPLLIAESRGVSPSYFEAMQIPLLSGELCRQPVDVAAGREVMVNRSFADRYLPGRSAIGLHLSRANASARITGIVGNARELGLNRDPSPTVYDCYAASSPSPWYLIRTSGEPIAAVLAVRSKIGELEPFRPVYDIAPLDARIGRAYAEDRLRTVLLTLFSATALVLACLGVYGTLSYVVNLRRREVGLRVALGAVSTDIVAQFLVKALRVVLLACVAGIALSFAFTRLLANMLFGVTPFDPATLSTVVVLVTVVAVLAALLPSLRAARVDPMHALRYE